MNEDQFSLREYLRQTNALFGLGDPARLEEHHFAAIRRLEEIGQADSLEAASVFNEVASWLRGVSRYEESLDLYMRALAIMEAQDQAETDMAQRIRLNLATLYRLMGDLDKADALFDQLCKELGAGSDLYAYVSALNNYSLVCQDKGDFQRALDLYETLLELLPCCPNADEHELGTTYVNAAGVYLRMHDYAEAEKSARDGIALLDAMDREDSHLASAWNVLGSALFLQGKLEEAKDAFERALDLDYKYYGRNVDYARISNSLAHALERLGDRQGALDRQRDATDILVQLFGPEDARAKAYRAYLDALASEDGRAGHER